MTTDFGRTLEEFVPLPSNPRYQVSRDGKVIGTRRKLLVPFESKGYHAVNIWEYGKVRNRRVHTLVAETFIGPRPDGQYVSHRNGNAYDNRVENLYYASSRQNYADAVTHGTSSIGDRCGRSKLTLQQAAEIKAMKYVRSGELARELSAKYSVHPTTIRDIWIGKSWARAFNALPKAGQ